MQVPEICAICKKKGHIARVCKAKAQVGSTPHKKQPKRNHYLDADSADTPAEGTYSALFNVRYSNHSLQMAVQVIQGAGPNLMGRDWLNAFEVSST